MMRYLVPMAFIFFILTICYAQQGESVSVVYQHYINSLCELSEAYYYDGRIDEAVEIIESNLKHVMNFSPENKSTVLAQYSKVLYYKHSVQGKSYDLPIEKIKEAIFSTEKTNNLSLLADLQDLMGLALYSQAFTSGEFNLSEPYYQKALKHREQLNDSRGIAETIFHLGLLKEYRDNDKNQALLNYRHGYALAEKGNHKTELSYLARHIGGILLSEEKLDSAEYYLNLSLTLRKEVGLKLFYAPALTALAELMKQKKDFTKASSYLSEAIENAKQTNAYRFLVSALIALGNLEFSTNNNSVALEHYKEALMVSESTNYQSGIESAKEKINSLIK